MHPFLQETGPVLHQLYVPRKMLAEHLVRGQNNDVRFQIRLAFISIGLLVFVPMLAGDGLVTPSQRTRPSARIASAPQDKVDINSATLDQLMKVPGMTRTWAARIVRYRPYRAKNELLDRGVVTNQVFSRIKDFIVAHRVKQ
jgi:DNA uptake protein ComE-like DNA-binding protein